jgi:hypothetical protein
MSTLIFFYIASLLFDSSIVERLDDMGWWGRMNGVDRVG